MPDRPIAPELLEIARATVLQELLPQLPPSAHYAARMVANAIVVARREHGATDPDVQFAAEFARMLGLSAEIAPDWPSALSDRIRAGAFDHDPELRARLADALARWTRARVAIANPRILDIPAA